MTREEVLNKFKVLIDKSVDVSFGGYPAFIDSEIVLFLEQAMKEVLSNKFTGTQNQVGFEGNVKRISDLQGLISQHLNSNAVQDPFEQNVMVFTLPNDFWLYVDSAIRIVKGDSEQNQRLELIAHEESKRFTYTSTNKPWIPEPKCIVKDNSLYVFYDTDLVDEIRMLALTYIYMPKLFVTQWSDSETTEGERVSEEILYPQLEIIADEIINRAVLIALENIEAPRTETKAQLNSIQE